MTRLVSGGKIYSAYPYDGKEDELEKVVEEQAGGIFGEYSFYINLKKRLRSERAELGTVPDGFLLDLSDPNNPILFIVEVELNSHGLEHIATQILKFAISYKESKPKLNRAIKKFVRSDKELQEKIENRLRESKKYAHLDQLMDAVMDKEMLTVIVPIDGLDESLKEVQKYLEVPINYIQIQTYVDNTSGERIHRYTPLFQEEEAAKITEVGTFYRFEMDDIELVHIPRSKFDEEHNISKHAQGYTFIRDESGKPTGVVFWWYKGRVDRHTKEEVKNGRTWAGTRRPVDPSSYETDMDVYVGETFWDLDTGKQVENPEYRIKGKLKEIYRVDGDKKTKIFPHE